MATGYTYPVAEGKITTFNEFAKICMRAFGATIHMRDEPNDKEYEPQIPSDYHTKEIDKLIKDRDLIKSLSDKKLVARKKREILSNIEGYKELKEKARLEHQRMEAMLLKVKAWTPPTEAHDNIKKFMIDQLTISLDHDYRYYDKWIEQLETQLQNLDPVIVRRIALDEIEKNLTYHLEENRKEIKRCNESNQWVKDLLESIKE